MINKVKLSSELCGIWKGLKVMQKLQMYADLSEQFQGDNTFPDFIKFDSVNKSILIEK